MKTAVDKVGIGKMCDVRFATMIRHYAFDSPPLVHAQWRRTSREEYARCSSSHVAAYADLSGSGCAEHLVKDWCKLLWTETAHGRLPENIARSHGLPASPCRAGNAREARRMR